MWNHNIHICSLSIWQILFFVTFEIAAIISFIYLISIYGARVRGSVFRILFRSLIREFESAETSPGSAQLPGENLVSLCKTADRFHEASKKIVTDILYTFCPRLSRPANVTFLKPKYVYQKFVISEFQN